MKHQTRGRVVLLVLGLSVSSSAARLHDRPALAAPTDGIIIEDVTLISPERPVPLPHAFVVIRGGRVAQIGTGSAAGGYTQRLDGRGRFLIPGLIDSHVHLGSTGPLDDAAISTHPELLPAYRSQLPRAYLAFGFTTLVDLDLGKATLAWFDAAPVRPHLYHSGRGVRIAGGYMAQQVPKDAAQANEANLVYEAAQAEGWPAGLDPRDYTPDRAVDRVARAGGICVKAFLEPGFGGYARWPVPRPETLEALRAEARRRGLVFVVHANAAESWNAALQAHPDVIAHGLWQWPGDALATAPPQVAQEAIGAAAHDGAWVQPTLRTVYGAESVFDWSLLDDPRLSDALPRVVTAYLRSDQGRAARQAIANEYSQAIASLFGPTAPDAAGAMKVGPARATATLQLMLAAHVKLLFGSDTGSNEGIGNPPGLNGRLELQHWADAGVPLARILRAATLDNAMAFRLSADVGTIEVGKRADLLLLGANPLHNIAAYDAIDTVILDGKPLARGSLSPADR